MSNLNIRVSHKLTQDVAAERIKGLLNQLKREYGDQIKDLSEDWNGNSCRFSFSVMGSSISGTLDVLNDEVLIKGDLPFAARLFKGRIEETIRAKAEDLLR
ncbi:MAG: polyhydroxyalkanoic acid system family protein [Acidobacteriota bacterium]